MADRAGADLKDVKEVVKEVKEVKSAFGSEVASLDEAPFKADFGRRNPYRWLDSDGAQRDDIPYKSNHTRPDPIRSLIVDDDLESGSVITSMFGAYGANRGLRLVGTTEPQRPWVQPPCTGPVERKLPPPEPHWINPNYSFLTLNQDFLYEAGQYFLENRIDNEHYDDKYKIRGVVYEDQYNVEFTIRLFQSKVPRQFACEVHSKKGEVMPFQAFYKRFKGVIDKHVYRPYKQTAAESKTLKAPVIVDDLAAANDLAFEFADFKADPVSISTLAPFTVMIESTHEEVRKQGLRCVVALAVEKKNGAENSKAIVETQRWRASSDLDDNFDWVGVLSERLFSKDREMVRLACSLLSCMCQVPHKKFREAVGNQCVPKLLDLLSQPSDLLLREIRRHAAATLAGVAQSHSALVLQANKTAAAILSPLRYHQDYELRRSVSDILNSPVSD